MNNIFKFHAVTLLQNLAFTLPIWVIFGTDYLGLTNVQSYWLGTSYWLISTLFEIPTGSWADRLGRKKIYGLGTIIGCVALVGYTLTKDFTTLLLLQILIGFAVALKSGPLGALIYDWLKSQGREKEYLNVTSNNLTVLFVGRVIGALIGGFSYTLHPTYPYLLSALSYAVSLIFVHSLEESKHLSDEPLSDKKIIRESIVKFVLLIKKVDFATVFVAASGFTLLANAVWYGYQPYFKELGFDESMIGLIYVPISMASAIGSQVVKRIYPRLHVGYLFALMLAITGFVALAVSTYIIWVGIAAVIVLSVIFGFSDPAFSAYAQKYYPSKIRSTMNSVESLIGSVVIVAASMTTGIFMDYLNSRAMFWAVALTTIIMAAGVGMVVWKYIPQKRNDADQSNV